MVIVIVVISVIVIGAGLICYRIGTSDGYEQAVEKQLLDFDKQTRMYKDLLDRYDILKAEMEVNKNDIENTNSKASGNRKSKC